MDKHAKALKSRVTAIQRRFIKRPLPVFVIDWYSKNASMTPFGVILIAADMWDEPDSELEVYVAHELGHWRGRKFHTYNFLALFTMLAWITIMLVYPHVWAVALTMSIMMAIVYLRVRNTPEIEAEADQNAAAMLAQEAKVNQFTSS